MSVMDEHKLAWLKSMGFADDKSVVDCNVTAETITFQTADGPRVRQKAQVFSRVMGYFQPTSFWNIGKQGEFEERVCFREDSAGCRELAGDRKY